jgi:hypothetical protein
MSTVAGCNDGTDFGGINLGAPRGGDGGTVGLANQNSCGTTPAPAVEKLDPSTLPGCAPACAGAHCVPTEKVPAVSRSSFAACGGGYCIPDTLIRSGAAKPPSCKSLNNLDGVCLSVCVPQVAEHDDALPRANCAADERCAPCINPNDNQPTGACAIGAPVPATCENPDDSQQPATGGPPQKCPHEGPPVFDPSTLIVCGGPSSGAHCLAASLISPPELKSRLTKCPDGSFCVPDKLITTGGRFIPKTCTSTAGAEGRCQSRVLPEVSSQPSLPVADCDETERCVPCYNPVDGSETGACKTSCDPGPQRPPVLFTDCCSGKGKCVPASSVPASFQSSLKSDGCIGGDLCAPTENINPGFVPPACTGWGIVLGNYSGVCLSNCVDFGMNDFAIVQGSCDGDHRCAPCTDPNGNPTGAPGCP